MGSFGAVFFRCLRGGQRAGSEAGCFRGLGGEALVLAGDADQLNRVEEIAEGVGAVPELMLLPEAGGDREEQKLVNVRGGYGDVGCGAVWEAGPLPAKKSSRVQMRASQVSFMQAAVSWEISSQDHSPC